MALMLLIYVVSAVLFYTLMVKRAVLMEEPMSFSTAPHQECVVLEMPQRVSLREAA